MDVLKKIKASTLMETLVATVLIVVVFMISSMILNNVFYNSIKNSAGQIDAHLNELHYLYLNEKLQLPYHDDFGLWKISVNKTYQKGNQTIVFEALNSETNKRIEREVYDTQ